jgi:carboxyl-terminal processing protease
MTHLRILLVTALVAGTYAGLGFAQSSRLFDISSFAGRRIRVEASVKDTDVDASTALRLRVGNANGFLYRGTAMSPGAAEVEGLRTIIAEAAISHNATNLRVALSGTASADARLDAVTITAVDPETRPPPSARAAAYLRRALAVLESHSINRHDIDWARLHGEAMRFARGAVSEADTYIALRFAIAELGDGHSYLQTPQRRALIGPGPVSNARTGRRPVDPVGRLLASGRVAYLAIPGFAGGTQRDQAEFAGTIQTLIDALDVPPSCGWIVDLRSNSGGNLWPMLVGLGPLLGNGEIGAAVYPDRASTPIWYENGKAGLGDYVQLRLTREPHVLARPEPTIAVLTSDRTASSAEVLVTAFTSLPNVQSFGAPTRGLSTGTRIFDLSDGASIVLAVAATSDRQGIVQRGPIAPDSLIDAPSRVGGGTAGAPDSADATLAAALAWLAARPRCL